MSVLGFDIGNENCVIAAVKQRGIDVLLNDESKRETPAVVSFGEKQRFLGSAGAACATMNPKSTISQVKRLIGRNFDDPIVQNDLRLLPFETSKASNGGVLIHLQYLNEKQTFTPVQILGMIFTHLKQTAEKSLEVPVLDCVMGIPCYFTDLQRRLYLDAAKIAGLRPLRLIPDCTATALGYGIYRADNPSSDPSCVVFVDIGHSDTQVAVVSFESGYMKILSHTFDCNLGARDFDEVLFCHFAAQFKEQYDIDVYSNARACIRLRAACEKLKKVLSANLEAPLHIECLMDEKDVKGFIKRDEFESLSSVLLDRILNPCRKALIDAGVAAERIQSVELVGSGSRIPAIGKALALFFQQEPRRTLNASECVARGCALQCAMLSPTFRVKDYQVEDTLPFSIGFSIVNDAPEDAVQNGLLFRKGHSVPSDKMFTFHRSSTFEMETYYADEKELPSGVSSAISRFKVGPFPSHNNRGTVKVKARLTLQGTVSLASASLVGADVDDVAIRSNKGMPAERMEVESDYGTSDVGNGEESVDDHTYSNPSRNTPSSHIPGKRVRAPSRVDIPIDEIVIGGMSKDELLNAHEKETQLAQQDFRVEEAKEKKNSLEAYVYEMRNKILSEYQPYAMDSDRDFISEELRKTEDWLYDDGEDVSASLYTEKLEELMKLVDPIERRYKDKEDRERASRVLVDTIRECRRVSQSLRAREKEAVLTECGRCEQWLQEMTQQQDSMPKYEDPVLRSSQIEEATETLIKHVDHITKSSKDPPQPYEESYFNDRSVGGDDMQVD